MTPLVNDPDEKEQRTRRYAMVYHHHQRALHALQRQRKNAEHYEAQVTHRAVGDQLLEVGLHHRHQRAVNDSDYCQHQDDRANRRIQRRTRKKRKCESEEAEGPHLQHDTGKNHRACRWRFDVRVRKPCVEWEHRHLHREGEEESREEPECSARGKAGIGGEKVVVAEVRRPAAASERQP